MSTDPEPGLKERWRGNYVCECSLSTHISPAVLVVSYLAGPSAFWRLSWRHQTPGPGAGAEGVEDMSGKTSIEWLPIPDVPGYEVSEDGRIRNTRTSKELAQQSHPAGHKYIQLRLGGRNGQLLKLWVHRAVLTAFVRYPWPNEEGRHLNGNPADNNRKNLCWGTRWENMQDKQRHGTQTKGEAHASAKLTEVEVLEIRKRVGRETLRSLAAEYGVSHTAIRRAANGMKWGHLNV